MRHSLLFFSVLLLASHPRDTLSAQALQPAAMRGQVQDDQGHALEAAQIQILGLDLRTTTSAAGNYRIPEIPPGKYWIMVRRVGYQALRAALSFRAGQDREVTFELDALPLMLPELAVQVEDRKWAQQYRDFVWRSKSGFGIFITHDEIERIRPISVGDLVRRYVPYFQGTSMGPAVWAGGWGHGGLGWSGGSAGGSAGNCAPAVSLNGGRPAYGLPLPDLLPYEDIEAVEVYRRPSDLPGEFGNWGRGCGLIVLWLR